MPNHRSGRIIQRRKASGGRRRPRTGDRLGARHLRYVRDVHDDQAALTELSDWVNDAGWGADDERPGHVFGTDSLVAALHRSDLGPRLAELLDRHEAGTVVDLMTYIRDTTTDPELIEALENALTAVDDARPPRRYTLI